MTQLNGNTAKVGLYKRITEGLERQPAYLLVFAVSALFVLSGLVSSAAAVVKDHIGFGVLGLVSFAIALITVVIVVREVEQNLRTEPKGSSPGDIEQSKNEHSRKSAQSSDRGLPPVVTARILPPPPQLTKKDEWEFLAEFPEWSILDTDDSSALDGTRRELYRVYEFRTFVSAFRFMTEVVTQGIQKRDHHPRWQNTYNRVEVWLTTFNLKYRLSERDIRLAKVFEKVWREQLKSELRER